MYNAICTAGKGSKVGVDPFVPELVVPFGHTGCVALFEIEGNEVVTGRAVRHQRENDHHGR